MQISKQHRLIAYNMMLIVPLILAGYSIGIKIYVLGFMFIVVGFLAHSRLYGLLELKEDNPLKIPEE
ncbi:hypothetical protein LCGC14_2716900 [marine sediment metagenome]|uniref:Uncharacterized protein n=1 Tax=marine sediment metagenome TaxID=412755 RepID=A0A0F9C312_9ZZZZ